MELASPADVRLAHHAILPTKAVFSLNFSSAAKGPFIASKTMCTLLGEEGWYWSKLSSLKCHSLILRPISRKSAVVIKTTI